jgi:hypothetical protein
MEASIALGGQVSGASMRVQPVAEVIAQTVEEFRDVASALSVTASVPSG